MKALVHICPFYNFNRTDFGDKYANESIYTTIQSMALSFNDTLSECEWQNQVTPCSKLFTRVMTEQGLCFAFNALNTHELYTEMYDFGTLFHVEWTFFHIKTRKHFFSEQLLTWLSWIPARMYQIGTLKMDTEQKNHKKIIPFAFSMHVKGQRWALVRCSLNGIWSSCAKILCKDSKYLWWNKKIYWWALFNTGRIVILQHSPGETIEMSRQLIRTPLLEETEISVKASLTRTSKRLRSYSSTQRQCFFRSERELHFFKIYTQSNCEAECLANFTYNECHCVKFSMPSKTFLRSFKVWMNL